jgi:hypothetical protein
MGIMHVEKPVLHSVDVVRSPQIQHQHLKETSSLPAAEAHAR